MGHKYYAVRHGRKPGIYTTWSECRKQVIGFPQAEYKSFKLKREATEYFSQRKPESEPGDEPVHVLQFDGASKGNPGKAGAGALLLNPDGSVLQELTLALGTATNNFAEYQSLILGLQAALDQNISRIRVHGDSNLVCKQVAGKWAVRTETLVPLHAKAKLLSEQFSEFSIHHFDRGLNAAADALANKAIQGTTSLPTEDSEETVTTVAVSSTSKASVRKNRVLKPGTTVESSKVEVSKLSELPLFLLEYDGASKGNPGKAGAGAVLRDFNGRVLEKLCVGLGRTTNNLAEYEGLLLGLRAALAKGITRLHVSGDSTLVCMQVNGDWAVKHELLKPLHAEVLSIMKQFVEFKIVQIDREFNSDADILANKGVTLPYREILVKPGRKATQLFQAEVSSSTLVEKTKARVKKTKATSNEAMPDESGPKTKRRSKNNAAENVATVEELDLESKPKTKRQSKRITAGDGDEPVPKTKSSSTGDTREDKSSSVKTRKRVKKPEEAGKQGPEPVTKTKKVSKKKQDESGGVATTKEISLKDKELEQETEVATVNFVNPSLGDGENPERLALPLTSFMHTSCSRSSSGRSTGNFQVSCRSYHSSSNRWEVFNGKHFPGASSSPAVLKLRSSPATVLTRASARCLAHRRMSRSLSTFYLDLNFSLGQFAAAALRNYF